MAEERTQRRENRASPEPEAAPVETTWQGSTMYLCPACGRTSEDKDLLALHMHDEHAGFQSGGEQ